MPDMGVDWLPYTPPEGSLVELFSDGSFLIEGVETRFPQESAVQVSNTMLSAEKEEGAGTPLMLCIYRGATPVTIVLAYADRDGSGPQWYRKTAGAETTASPIQSARQRLLPSPPISFRGLNTDLAFKLAFFGFLAWYLLLHHETLKGVASEERFPGTTLHASPDGEMELTLPPKKTLNNIDER